MSTRPTSKVDAVILTALGLEFQAVRAHLSAVREVTHKGTVYEVGEVGHSGPRVAVVETGAGNVRAAVEAERSAEFFRPRLLLFVGVAGGVKDAGLGDVVAATKVYGYETAKEGEVLRLRPDAGLSSYELEQRARAVVRSGAWTARRIPPSPDLNPSPKAFVGPIAAGEKVVASTASRTYELIRSSLSDTLAVEMEGIGTLQAARANAGVQSIVVRGVSDLLDDKGVSDAEGYQPVAAASAAAFAVEVIVRAQAAASGFTSEESPPTAIEAMSSRGPLAEAEQIATSLYPGGPMHDEIWSRAGGDVSALTLTGNGRAMWHRAFSVLDKGGGGTTLTRLLDAMAEEYPNHLKLSSLRRL